MQMPPSSPVAKCGEPGHVFQAPFWARRRLLDCRSSRRRMVFFSRVFMDVSEDFLFRYSATNGSTRGYSATFCTLVPGVSLPQAAS